MKKYVAFALSLVLTAAFLTACGCTSQDAKYTTAPTTMPTIMTTAPTTEPSRPTTEATTPTADRGNGPMDESTVDTSVSTDAADSTGEAQARQMQPSFR